MPILDFDDDKVRRNVVLCSILVFFSAAIDIQFPIWINAFGIAGQRAIGPEAYWGTALAVLTYMCWHYWSTDGAIESRKSLAAAFHALVSAQNLEYVRGVGQLACDHAEIRRHPGEELDYQPYVFLRGVVDSALIEERADTVRFSYTLENEAPHFPPWTARCQIRVLRIHSTGHSNFSAPEVHEFVLPQKLRTRALIRAALGLCFHPTGPKLFAPFGLALIAAIIAIYQLATAEIYLQWS